MMTFVRRFLARRFASSLALILGSALLAGSPALAQQGKEPPPKEPTDGFFDVPARDTSQDGPATGVDGYIATAAFAGLAMFILCKSARRS